MISISQFGQSKCIWCCQQSEGVQATFPDGLKGFLCKKDFWAALKARAETKETKDIADKV